MADAATDPRFDAMASTLPPPRRPSRSVLERWPRLTDLLLAALAFVATLVLWLNPSRSAGWSLNDLQGVALYLCAFIASFALLWRRAQPFRVHAVVLGASVLVLLSGVAEGVVGLLVSLYSLGRYEPDRVRSIAGAAVACMLVVTDLELFVLPGPGAWWTGMMVVLVWYVGRRFRFRGEYLRLLEERAAQMERARDAEAEKAVAAERTRIAREMHDVIAHQVSLMTVQAGAARTVLQVDPEAASDAIGAVEQAGRQALSEMRHLLGVLRQSEPNPALDPQPGIGDLPALIRQVEEAGPVVHPTIRGEFDALPTRLQLTVYRIVQEALTNVIKHAGSGVQVNLDLECDGGAVRIAVIDDGQGLGIGIEGGHGLAGMRERAALLGGELTARRGEQGGFEVRAVLPVDGSGR